MRCWNLLLLLLIVAWTAAQATAADRPATVGERLWIWTHPAGAHDGYDLGEGRKVRSRMTPVEGAGFLGVRNLYFIHYPNNPPPAGLPAVVESFRPLERVVLSLTGAGGDTSAEGRATVLNLARRHANVVGFILDDFLHWQGDPAPGPWLAANEVRFPVEVVISPPAPAVASKLELIQTDWPTGDYRTRDYAVDVAESPGRWREAHRGTLPNAPGSREEVRLPGTRLTSLRIRILSTHDRAKARSCGLRMIRIWREDQPLDLEDWTASASSTYSERFPAANLLAPSSGKRPASGSPPLPASLSPPQLKGLRTEIAAGGRPLPLTCVIYDYQVSPRILPHVNEVDRVAFWTWRSDDLAKLEANFERLERIVHPKPIVLGCYLYDYGGGKPMSVERMRRQCELGLTWLKEGRIEGMIFLASNVCDQGLPAVAWTRDWIRSVRDQPLTRRDGRPAE